MSNFSGVLSCNSCQFSKKKHFWPILTCIYKEQQQMYRNVCYDYVVWYFLVVLWQVLFNEQKKPFCHLNFQQKEEQSIKVGFESRQRAANEVTVFSVSSFCSRKQTMTNFFSIIFFETTFEMRKIFFYIGVITAGSISSIVWVQGSKKR